MIHKYNIDELNIPDRSIKALPGFKNEDTSQPKGLYHTSQAQAFGYGQKLDANAETCKFEHIKNNQSGLRQPRPFVE